MWVPRSASYNIFSYGVIVEGGGRTAPTEEGWYLGNEQRPAPTSARHASSITMYMFCGGKGLT